MREELRAALRTVLAFSLGIVIGALARPEPSAVLPYAYLFLYLVVGAAGVYVGLSWRKLLGAGRRIAVRGLAFTASAIAGDIVAGLIIAVPLGLPLWLTVDAALGSGWYSFTGPFLSLFSATMGVIGFVGNQLREDLTLALFPLLKEVIGEGSVVMGGATSMDTTLGVITRYAGPEVGLEGMVQG
ncbi:MAG: lysine exporter LysO family protein, partial [Acidilobus sp.]|nr:lysine exporter LysO family protein [Acidilobus sp.]